MAPFASTLLGRQVEQRKTTLVLDRARHGCGGALVFYGDAGIGKSSLLEHAAACADGMQVLAATGTGTETELSFAGLHALLGPLLPHLLGVPTIQSQALSAAFALCPADGTDAFMVAAGALSLVVAASAESPVLLLVDDLHNLDRASREAVMFVGRRLSHHRVALVCAARGSGGTLTTSSGLPHHLISPLDASTSHELLVRSSDDPLAPTVSEALVAASGGVPLALVELPTVLEPAERSGETPLRDPLPVSPAICQSFGSVLDRLTPRQREPLVVAAVAGDLDLSRLVPAVARLGGDQGTLEAAEAAGAVQLSSAGTVFRPGLLRAVVYQQASPALRRRAHAALAEVSDAAERARHLGQAALRPDEQVAGEIEALIRQESRRAGPGPAALLMERAAGLSITQARRAERLTLAAELWQHAARPDRAIELVNRALRCCGDVRTHGRIQAVRGRQELLAGRPLAAHRLLVHEAARVRATDPARSAAMLTDAAEACCLAGQLRSGQALARHARLQAAGAPGMLGAVVAVQLAAVHARSGSLAEARELIEEWAGLLEDAAGDDAVPLEYRRMTQLVYPGVLLRLGELTQAWCAVDAAVQQCRSHRLAAQLPGLLGLRAQVHLRLGEWDAAREDCTEALALARRAGQPADEVAALATAARLAAGSGAAEDCRRRLEQARALCRERTLTGYLVPLDSAEALLELGLGDAPAALTRLEQVARRVRSGAAPDPGAVSWASDLVEAAVRCGRPERARGVLPALERQSTGSATLPTVLACCRLLLADKQTMPAAPEGDPLDPFETARTDLCLGVRLAEAGKAPDGRARLLAAAEVFDRLGAAPWAERARCEFAALGVNGDHLTAQEHRVAELVAGGATNREAAKTLYLSQKTVEFHLRNVFRKFDLRSRAELAVFLIGNGRLPPTSGATWRRD